MVDTYDGVYELSTDFANFMCSEDYGTDCSPNTVGDFLETAKLEAGTIMHCAPSLRVRPMTSDRVWRLWGRAKATLSILHRLTALRWRICHNDCTCCNKCA